MKNLNANGVLTRTQSDRRWLFAIVMICSALAVHFWVEHVSAKIVISINFIPDPIPELQPEEVTNELNIIRDQA